MIDLFPELRRSRANANPADGGAGSGGQDCRVLAVSLGPASTALEGGEQSLVRWRRLLGLERLASREERLRLSGARLCYSDGRMELLFDGRGFGRAILNLNPCLRPGLDRPGVNVTIRGTIDGPVVQQLLFYLQERLRDARYETLTRVFRLDPEAREVTVPRLDGDGAEEIFARSVARVHAGAGAWRIFTAQLEQRRNFNHYLSGNVCVVKHEDLECGWATPAIGDGTISFFNYSSSHLERAPRAGGEGQGGARAGRTFTTDLRERDVVEGGAGRLARLLDAVSNGPDRPDVVLVKTSCVPKVIGDDPGPAMAEFERRTGIPTVGLDVIANEDASFLSALLERLPPSRDGRDDVAVDGRVNLVGFPRSPEMDRLVAVLERLGITINTRIVPQVRLDDVARYPMAALQVFYDSALYRDSFRQIVGSASMRSLYTTPPFGVGGSRRWLEQVAAALRLEAALEERWREEWLPREDRWERLREAARGHRLGFVVDACNARALLDPAEGTGVPMLAVLEELGFDLEFLCWGGDADADRPALPGESSVFGDARELEELLRRSSASAFYTEYYFDRRLTRCGKSAFSVSDFRLGIDGALATAERLIRSCELPFYRRYGALAGSPFASSGG